jgi:hypothetical protein
MVAGWAPRSSENAELAYGRLLGFLRRNGRLYCVQRVGERLVPVDVAPERALMIVGALGHSGFRTAQDHYVKGQQRMAVIKYQQAVRQLKRGRSG